LLLVPSLINRWYVLDLREGVSLARAMVDAGLDTWCLDWGVPEDEDRLFTWDDVVARLARMVRRVKRETGAPRVALLGYCVGGTLSAIHTALHPDSVAALVNLAGPIDFSQGGALAHQTNPRWFDPQSIGDAGNVAPWMMQSGFVALRPTLQVAKWVGFFDKIHDASARDAFEALEAWANDNVPFPGAAYATYVRELYQENALAKGEHRIAGSNADLSAIDCPLLTVVTEKDTICPPPAARALNELASSRDAEVFTVPGGHVGAVVGGRAPALLYPKLASWLSARLDLRRTSRDSRAAPSSARRASGTSGSRRAPRP
jgi:polyhydroxyalkanoate synthase